MGRMRCPVSRTALSRRWRFDLLQLEAQLLRSTPQAFLQALAIVLDELGFTLLLISLAVTPHRVEDPCQLVRGGGDEVGCGIIVSVQAGG